MTAASTACGGGNDNPAIGGAGASTSSPSASTTVTSAPTGTTVPAMGLTLRMRDVRLLNSEESDNGLRVLLPAGVASASVTVTGLPTPNQVVSACQANELDKRLNAPTCRTPTNGQPVSLDLGAAARGVELIQVGVSGAGAPGNSTALDEVTITYTATSREVSVRLPQIAAGDGGKPTFALTPASTDGAYRASVSWMVIPVFGGTPASARLEFLQGGNVTNTAEGGGGQVQLSGNVLPPTADLTIRVQNTGGNSLVSPKLSLLLP